MIDAKITLEWIDKNLSGASVPRDNDIPINIEIDSDTNPTLLNSVLIIRFTHYAEGTKTTITKASDSIGGITFQELSENKIKAITKLTDGELNSLPPSVDITIYYKLNCVFPVGNEITIKEGSFISKAL